ncbi:NAD(P)H azoreductase [Andreprevotia sp. IGB-42]|uniref:NmrA family NAD(P)-binding protein n=1 Tax=Andreprevotia sp. IGB-42 TaxID=2497473 RepID=UPI001356F65F|nr:NmrA family NAD(P)-binding protein [Andreprevotia sp. IGB-42]KAF0813455.1 NAD(P)H azoreductase [Andreprevotia sp. IGB-42]
MTASSSLPYVVFGVTGRTGAAAAETLLRSGHPVRVVVRDPAQGQAWAARGASVAVADMTDLVSMVSALNQAKGAYVVCPQHYDSEDLFERADLIADITARAAIAAKVPRLVALSSVGADRENGTGWIRMNRLFEQRLREAGVPAIFLRAAYFMENWMPLLGLAVHSGRLPTFLAPAQRAIPMVATVDVGRTAAALLQDDGTDTAVVTLTGPKDYAPDDVAAIVSITLHKPVDVAVLPEAAWPQALADAHFSQAALAGFIEMTRGLNGPHIDINSDPGAVGLAGTTTLEQVIAELIQRQR